MNRNKEYRLKRKSQRKDYIIQDKNFTIKTLYYRNETKRNKIEQLQQENKQLKEQVQDLKADYGTIAQIERDLYKEVIEEVREKLKLERKVALSLKHPYTVHNIDDLLQILDKVKGE